MQVILTVLLLYKGVKHTKKERVIGSPSCLSFPKNKTYVLYKIMITFQTFNFNNYSQDSYDLDISSLALTKIKCTCGSTGHFHRHAVYPRYLTLDSDNTILISIVRIKCESCNCTHALLPSIIILLPDFVQSLYNKNNPVLSQCQ